MSARVLGADFSGARDAGRSLWVTEARLTDDGLVVEACYSGADRWGVDRESAHAGLADRVTDDFATVGLDFPFSLPQPLLDVDCGGTWQGLLDWLADGGGPGGSDGAAGGTENKRASGDSRGPSDPSSFAAACRASARAYTDDSSAALRRETDLRRAALCPYGTRVQYQTFHGIRNVLAPLAAADGVAVAPMQTRGSTRVVEVYPAATFGWLGLYREGYKGENGDRRVTNVDGVEACSVDLGGFRETYETNHDALDSLAAAVSAGRNVDAEPALHGPLAEGHIYV